MTFNSVDELKAKIVEELNTEFSGSDVEETVIGYRVSDAISELKMKRNYAATSWTEEKILADIENYISTIKTVARYDLNQIGAEGETRHNENGVDRTYLSRDELWKGVHAFVKVLC